MRKYTLAIILLSVAFITSCYDRKAEASRSEFETLALLSEQYEKENLYKQQMECQYRMLDLAKSADKKEQVAEAHQRIATTYMVMCEMEKAADEMKLAYEASPADSLDFRAQTLLMRCQIAIQQEQLDQARSFCDSAVSIYPAVTGTDLYRLSHIYTIEDTSIQEQFIGQYLEESSIYVRAELLRLRMALNADQAAWQQAFHDGKEFISLQDSITSVESSKSMEQIHALQHDQELEHTRNEILEQRTHLMLLLIIILVLIITAFTVGILYRRRAKIAHTHELEALKIAEAAEEDVKLIRNENIQLQRLYYEHLYAIILPIINARRKKSGHIDLEESSWKLIENNTDSVIPGFTAKLRHNHPSLTTEDLRFCCLIMMRVPNAVLADIYGIAPQSVAARKQRMKRKLDSELHEQTLENYLNQYLL